jgi:hypothetical protein
MLPSAPPMIGYALMKYSYQFGVSLVTSGSGTPEGAGRRCRQIEHRMR